MDSPLSPALPNACGKYRLTLFLVSLQINALSFDFCSAIKRRPKEGETYFDVVAIIDPVTRESQRLAPLLLVWTAKSGPYRPSMKWPHAYYSLRSAVSLSYLQRHWKPRKASWASSCLHAEWQQLRQQLRSLSWHSFDWLAYVMKKKKYPYLEQNVFELNWLCHTVIYDEEELKW